MKNKFRNYGIVLLDFAIILLFTFAILMLINIDCVADAIGVNSLSQSDLFKFKLTIFGLASVLSTYLLTKQAKYNDLVTKSRIEWMERVRKLYTVFFEITVDQANKLVYLNKNFEIKDTDSEKENYKKIKNEFYGNSKLIKSTVNTIGLYLNLEEHKAILKLSNKIVQYVSIDNKCFQKVEFKEMQQEVTEQLSLLMKKTWNDVKSESR